MQGDDTMRDDQLTIDCRCKDLVIVEGAEIKQGVAEGVRSKSGDFGSIQFMRSNQLLNEAGLGSQGLSQQRVGLGFLDPVGLDECASKSAQRVFLWISGHI